MASADEVAAAIAGLASSDQQVKTAVELLFNELREQHQRLGTLAQAQSAAQRATDESVRKLEDLRASMAAKDKSDSDKFSTIENLLTQLVSSQTAASSASSTAPAAAAAAATCPSSSAMVSTRSTR